MKTPNLLSPNDYKRIQKALETMTPDRFVFAFQNYILKVEVQPTGSAETWKQPFLITVTQEHGNIFSTQHFSSVDQMKKYFWM